MTQVTFQTAAIASPPDGTPIDVNAGTNSDATQRVTIATDDALNTVLGAQADAASTTTSIKAALRGIATALGITALDLGSGTGGSRTLRMFKDTAQWVGGSGSNGTAVQRMTIATDDGVAAVLGATSGAKVVTDATGTVQQYLRGLVSMFAAGLSITGSVALAAGSAAIGSLTAGVARIGIVAEPFMAVVGNTTTRPANTTVYAANDAVSNNATAGSVTPTTYTLSDTNDDPVALERCRVASTDTGLAGTVIRVWFYQNDPSASSGVVGGDNAAFSTKQGAFIGAMVGTFKTFSDGSVACCTPEDGSRIITKPTSGAKTVFSLYQTISGFTPSANSTTLIPTLEAFQGRT